MEIKLKRYLIVFFGFDGEQTEKLVLVQEHEQAVLEAKAIASAFGRAQLKQLGVIDEWEFRPNG